MKPLNIVLICVAIVGFMGVVVWSTLQGAEVECEVCLVFDGEQVCRLGRGATESDARMAAQQSACGGNAFGIAAAVACQNRRPDRSSCPAN